jgi:hypothetical protein
MALSKIVRDSLNTGIDDNSDATAITIDSSENVGIGTSTPAEPFHIKGASGAATDVQIQGGDDTNQIRLFIGGNTNRTNGRIIYNTASDYLAFSTGGDQRIRVDSDGLKFGTDTAAANALNDYETGTWTPTFLASGTNPTVNSVGNGTGYYVKVGDIVHFSYYTSAMNIGSAGSGAAYVGNLPFTSSNGSNEYWLFQYVHGTAIGSSVTGGYINNNQTAITFILPNSTSGVSWTAGSPQYMMIAGSYRAA